MTKSPRARPHGFSIVELILVAAIFSLFLLVSYLLLNSGLGVWQKTASSQDATFEMSKVRSSLTRDLRETSFEECAVAGAPPVPGSGRAIWFLSAVHPATGIFAQRADGSPLWQRNIVYYLTVPSDHDALFGMHCAGQDDRCPHKFLVRRVFDTGPATDPGSAITQQETLLSPGQVGDLLGRPQGYGLNISGPTAESQELVATGLLDFEVELQPGPWEHEIQVTVSAFNVQEAGKKFALGSESLKQTPYTHHLLFSVFPGN